MALKIKLPKEDVIEEQDELPGEIENQEEEEVVVKDTHAEEALRLKLENAELRGKLSVTQKVERPADALTLHEQAKAKVFSDINMYTDDQFEQIYKMPKSQASITMLDRENALTKAETKRLHAESEAKSEMGAKYGTEFYKYKAEIEEAVEDLSEEARKDPKRVARFMETKFLSLQREEKPAPRPGSVKGDEGRRKVVNDFDKPNPQQDETLAKKQEKLDVIAEGDRALAKSMGITSEKERLSYMTDFVPMKLGGGIWLKDPNKGFEKIEPTKV